MPLNSTTKQIAADHGLTSAEVVAQTGLSYRQLDHWTSTGRIDATWLLTDPQPGSGMARVYDADVVFHIADVLDAIAACPNCEGRAGRDTSKMTQGHPGRPRRSRLRVLTRQ